LSVISDQSIEQAAAADYGFLDPSASGGHHSVSGCSVIRRTSQSPDLTRQLITDN
jgi:hypothetical protein